ncbi:MAG: hypothetical protein GXP58_01845, partial [Deltaproteobacteria bacterium]|nr:hypothetical protein [Deltaproteobacteria bacterium]
VTVTATTDQGAQASMQIELLLYNAQPYLSSSPSFTDAYVHPGEHVVRSVTFINEGYQTLQNAQIQGLTIPWIGFDRSRLIGNVAPGASFNLGIVVSPPEGTAEGIYTDFFTVTADNHPPYTYYIQATVTSSTTGNVQFSVTDSLYDNVEGATVTVQNSSVLTLLSDAKTDVNGSVTFTDLPTGRYNYTVTAPGHNSWMGSFEVRPGDTTPVEVIIENVFVTIEWEVVPIVIEDRYEIKINTTFVADVPAPVVVVEPSFVNLPRLEKDQVFYGEYKVTNHGLIAAEDVTLTPPPSLQNMSFEILGTLPDRLEAMESYTLPFKITWLSDTPSTELQTLAALSADDDPLLSEITGYGGGGGCTTGGSISYKYVICPGSTNERTGAGSAGFSVGTGGCNGGISVGGGGGGGTSRRIQGSGGRVQGHQTCNGCSETHSITGTSQCALPPPPGGSDTGTKGTPGSGECTGSVVYMTSGAYTFDVKEELRVKTSSGDEIGLGLTYRSNRLVQDMDAGGTWKFGTAVNGPFGYNWFSDWFQWVDLDATTGKLIYNLEHRTITFDVGSDGNFLPRNDLGLIARKTATGYEIEKRGGETRLFNPQGKLVVVRNRQGRERSVNYDTNGFPASITDEDGREVLTFTTDANGHITGVTDLYGRSFEYQYMPSGDLWKIIDQRDPSNPITLYTFGDYSAEHGLQQKTVPGGYTYTITYNENNVVASITDPDLYVKNFYYDWKNGSSYTSDSDGNIREITYDETGRVLSDSRNGVPVKRIVYTYNNRAGLKVPKTRTTLNEAGYQTIETLDEFRHVTVKTDPEGNKTYYTYTDEGWLRSETDPLGDTTFYTYYTDGKLETVTDALGHITRYTYTPDGEVDTVTNEADPNDGTDDFIVKDNDYDALGNLVRVTEPGGRITTFEYDTLDRLTATIDAEGVRTEYGYDLHDHRTIMTVKTAQGDSVTTYDYDTAGRVTKITDPENHVTRLTYDFKGRITSTMDHDGLVTLMGYDHRGNLVYRENGQAVFDGNGNPTYDPATGLPVVTLAGNPVKYEYDNRNRKIKEIYPDNTPLDDTDNPATTYGYEAPTGCGCSGSQGSEPSRITDPEGNVTERGYDKLGRLTMVTQYIADDANSIPKYETDYGYDAAGNLTSITDADGNATTFSYDALNRLVQQTQPPRVSQGETAGKTEIYAWNP